MDSFKSELNGNITRSSRTANPQVPFLIETLRISSHEEGEFIKSLKNEVVHCDRSGKCSCIQIPLGIPIAFSVKIRSFA